jgi:HPt (histidine-containing phosphotransfer) domain-containing protein/ferritin
MQGILDRNAVLVGNKLGVIGRDYDRQLTPPIARFGAATARMASQVDGSLAQVRIEQAATAKELERAAMVAEASSRVQADAADRTTRAYTEQAIAAKTSASEQEAAALRVRAAQVAQVQSGGMYNRMSPGGQRVLERIVEHGGPDTGVMGIRGPHGGGIGNPVVVVMEAASRTGMGSLAAAVGESPASGGAKSTTIADGGGDGGGTTIVASGRGGGGGGGGGFLAGLLGGSGGDSGGGGINWRNVLWGKGAGGGGRFPILGALLGGGALAGAGTVGSFAGLGPEHLLFSALGLAGSATGAAAGGGLIAAGAAGQLAVGGGSDLAVMKSTITDTQALGKAYDKVKKAVAEYGAGSKQAKEAQHELNTEMAELGNTAGVKAELGLAIAGEKLNKFWDKQTSNARIQSVNILSQVLKLGMDYVPKVAVAAEQNLAIINKGIKPLFSWLEGPEGVGVWNDLEHRFKENLPDAVHASDQAVEFLLKTVDTASRYTGGFTAALDRFFTKWNSPQFFARWQGEIGRLIADFHTWWNFIKVIGQDLYYLFHNDAETGKAIVETITGMLERLREWEKSTTGTSQLSNIFTVHREEVVALLKLIPPLVSGLTPIYMTIAPPLVKAFTGIAEAIAWVLNGLVKLGPATRDLLGMALIAAKLGILGNVLTGVGGAFGLIAANEKKVVDMTGTELAAALDGSTTAAGKAAGANIALAGSEEAVAAGAATETGALGAALGGIPKIGNLSAAGGSLGPAGLAGLLARGKGMLPALTRGAALGGVGAIGANTIASLAGVHGTANTAVTLGGAGAGLGFTLGPAAGALLGTEIAPGIGTAIGAGIGLAAPYVVKFLGNVFSSHAPDYGKRFAAGFMAPLGPMLTAHMDKELTETLHVQRNATEKARNELREVPSHFVKGGLYKTSPGEEKSAFNKAFNKRFEAELREGLTAAEALKHALDAVSHPTTFAFTKGIIQQLRGLKGEARDAAAEAMVKLASELEHQGKLPKDAVSHVLKSLESEFPQLQQYFKEHSLATSQQVATAFKFKEAENNLTTTLNNLRSEWGLFDVDPKVTGASLVVNTGREMEDLRKIVATSTGTTKTEALQHLHELQDQSDHYFNTMLAHTDSTMAQWSSAVKAHLPGAVEAVKTEMGKLTEHVVSAMEAGQISASKGAELIGKALNSELKAFGAKELPLPVAKSVGGITAAAKQVANGVSKLFAGGGLVQIGNPGEAGHDSIPLNVGGMPIVVAPGEQVAVFNRHQLPVVNAALGPIGGLQGLFDTVQTPNYMATGGIVGKMVSKANEINSHHYPYKWGGGHANFQGPFDCSGAVSTVLHAAGLLARPEVSGELMNFGLPGPGNITVFANPTHTFMEIMGRFFGTHGSEGAGWYAGSGLPGFAVRHIPLNSNEGFGVNTPKVTGAGMVADIVRRGLSKDANAANRYLGHHMFGTVGPGISAPHGGYSKTQLEALWRQANPGLASSAHLMAAIALAESSGNPQARNSSGASGLWQILGLPFPGDPFEPLTNAKMAGSKLRSQGLGAWVTYTSGAYKQFMSRGGLVRSFARGGMFSPGGIVGHSAKAPKPKVGKPKGVRHVTKPRSGRKVSLGSLISNLSAIPGMASIVGQLGPPEGSYNMLVDEQELLANMDSNPASILAADMRSLSPTILPGELIGPGMLIPKAEREQQRAVQSHGESEGLSLQGQLLQWIGGLDDHRLLSPPDIGVLAKDFKHGVPFKAGYPIYRAQQSVLEAQKKAQELLVRIQQHQVARAHAFIKKRKHRLHHIERVLKATYQRYRNIRRQIEQLTTAGLKHQLSSAEAKQLADQRINDAQGQDEALSAAIANERRLPKYEQSESLIAHWEGEKQHLSAYMRSMRGTGAERVTSARMALQKNQLQGELKPLEESLGLLGGSSTKIGTTGIRGEVSKQIKGLTKGAEGLEGKATESRQSTIPQLELSIAQIKESLAEAAESVAPATIPGTGEKPGETELASLLKAQNEQLAQQLAVSQAQYKVLANLPPYAGKFHAGGIIPGPVGAERMALVQAGERITPAGAGDPHVSLHFASGMEWLKDFIDVRVQQGTRGMSRNAGRRLPGVGGGLT